MSGAEGAVDRGNLAVNACEDGLAKRVSELSPEKRAIFERLLEDQGAAVDLALIRRRSRSGPAPLSFAQQRLWFLEQLEPGSAVYNCQASWRFEGELDVAALERSLHEIVRRHEALRTTFPVVEGSPVQQVAPESRLPLVPIDLSNLPESEREAEARRRAAAEAARPFDLSSGPLVRAQLLRQGPADHLFVLTIHHIVFDGWSVAVFHRELLTLYAAFAAGEPSPLAELPLQYGDFAEWQRQWLQGEVLERQLAYWKRRLGGELPVLELPTDRPRPRVQSPRGAMETLVLPGPLAAALRAFTRRRGATLFMTLLAAFKVLLSRYTGQEDIVVGTPIASRSRRETEGLIGFFMNSLALRTDLGGDPSFEQLVERVKETSLGAYDHQDLPFESLVEELRPERSLRHTPVFQVFFNMPPAGRGLQDVPGLRVSLTAPELLTSKFDITLYVSEWGPDLGAALNYCTDLFDPTTIRRMLRHYQTLLESIVADPGRPLSELAVLQEEEQRLVSEARERRPRQPFVVFERSEADQSIGARFQSVARQHAGKLAVKTGALAWTYDDLNRAAQAVAHATRSTVGTEEGRVALLFDHDAPMVAAVLGTLLAGKTYVPLDPSHPRGRLAFTLRDAEVGAVLASGRHRGLARELAGGALPVIDVDEATVADGPLPPTSPETVAYILCTSGSTGQPKGVVQSHGHVLHHIRNYTNSLHIAADDRLSLLSSYVFDAAVMDMFGALLNGATLLPFDLRNEGSRSLTEWLAAERISIYHSTPTVFRHFVGSLPENQTLADVRLVVLGGEAVQRRDFECFRKHFGPLCFFVNGFGPTESTLALQYFADHETEMAGEAVPAGFPVGDTEILLLNEEGGPAGIRGEIAVRSPYLALGYWRRPELTRAAFLPDPAGGDRRIYRTGDLGHWRIDGSLAFDGRKDFQVKLRGFRVELGEVETALAEHPAVREAAAQVHADGTGEAMLVGYFVPAGQEEPSTGELREHLRQRLPDYMVPSAFVRLESLPLTGSRKLDRRALIPPALAVGGSAYVAPRTPAEQVLVGIWAELLRRDKVGIHDDFFTLGGHSLLATQLVSRVRAALQVELALRAVFESPTVAGMARLIERSRAGENNQPIPPIRPLSREAHRVGVRGKPTAPPELRSE